ncbi:Metallo-dependent phosphatase-like protein [Pilobolus umbonatus]|nr:Metallo-dependent phosphatase-like protein [Pilobolus umbonatus]
MLVKLNINKKSAPSYGYTVNLNDYYSSDEWNRTYNPFEPQQVHTSWMSEGKSFRVEFSTMGKIQSCQVHYWLKNNPQEEVFVDQSEDWLFVDGGSQQRQQYMHMLQTDMLAGSSVYQFQVITETRHIRYLSSVYELHTPDNISSSFKFLVTGDIGIKNGLSLQVAKDLVSTHEYDFIAIMGDQAYNMGDDEGTRGDQFMNQVQNVYANLPVLATAGNHEKAYNFSHYKHRFNLMPYRESGFVDAMQYSLNYKSVHFISISTEVFFDKTEDQMVASLNWLEDDLIEANKMRDKVPWIVVIGHRPLYCSYLSKKDCNENAEKLRFGNGGQRGLEVLFNKYQVDLYLCGHKHLYERTYPVRNDQLLTTSYHNPPSFFQVISGNGGNEDGPDAHDNSASPPWLAHRHIDYGITDMEVGPQFMNLYHYQCHINGTRGPLIDHVRVTKTTSHIHKQMRAH